MHWRKFRIKGENAVVRVYISGLQTEYDGESIAKYDNTAVQFLSSFSLFKLTFVEYK